MQCEGEVWFTGEPSQKMDVVCVFMVKGGEISIWTKQKQQTGAKFLGPGKAGSLKPATCGQHYGNNFV